MDINVLVNENMILVNAGTDWDKINEKNVTDYLKST
jgi:hypothetical protein